MVAVMSMAGGISPTVLARDYKEPIKVEVVEKDDEDYINEVLEEDRTRSGKQDNITLFGFSATPKKKTREKFGTTSITEDGKTKKSPFTCYSMQQAIEET